MSIKSVCVFCGANSGLNKNIQSATQELGKSLAKRQQRLVYGGGRVGLMGMVADAALANGGAVIGVIPQSLVDVEAAHLNCTELHVVKSMHERKAMMEQMSDAFVALPGGFGTLDELNEIITWKQLGIHNKKIIILNLNHYYDHFIEFISHAVQEGLIRNENQTLYVVANTVEECMSELL